LILHDEHPAVVVSGAREPSVGDVAAEAVFIEFVRIDGQVAEAVKLGEPDRQIGLLVSLSFLPNHDGETLAVVVKPILADFPRIERHAVFFQIHVAGRIEHRPLAILVRPDLGGGVLGRSAILVHALMPAPEPVCDPPSQG
jgi:hypothetical protein